MGKNNPTKKVMTARVLVMCFICAREFGIDDATYDKRTLKGSLCPRNKKHNEFLTFLKVD